EAAVEQGAQPVDWSRRERSQGRIVAENGEHRKPPLKSSRATVERKIAICGGPSGGGPCDTARGAASSPFIRSNGRADSVGAALTPCRYRFSANLTAAITRGVVKMTG